MTPSNNSITVVNISRCADFGKRPGDYYIGRTFHRLDVSYPTSKYANPFHIGKGCTREFVIAQYTDRLYAEGLAYEVRDDLADVKRLGCWCKPLPCHGDVLAAIARHGPVAYKAMLTQQRV